MPHQIITVLGEAGMSCRNPEMGSDLAGAKAQRRCHVEDSELVIRTYATRAAADKPFEPQRSMGICIDGVTGPTWSINLESAALADKIAAKLNGTAVHDHPDGCI